MTNKKIKVLVSLVIIGIIMSGCKSNKYTSTETNENTKVNDKAEDDNNKIETEVNNNIITEDDNKESEDDNKDSEDDNKDSEDDNKKSEDDNKESEDISQEEEISKKVDLSYLSDSVTEIIIYGAGESVLEEGNENEINDDTYDLKLVNTAEGYNLEVNTLQYKLGIDDTSYREFIERAVGIQYDINKDNDREYKLTNDTTLECLGEKFTLVSYIQNDMGRGSCELLGEDGKIYKILNDISFKMDPFTGASYFDILSSEGSTVTREISFGTEEAVVLIPHGTELEYKFNKYVNESPDSDLGNPIGVYRVQFDSNGNIIKIEE